MENSMNISEERINIELSQVPSNITKSAEKIVSDILDKAGIYYRVFVRTKSASSTNKKMREKKYGDAKKMQDVLGVRVVLYFKDDVEICVKMLKAELELVGESIDPEKEDLFKPTRLNLVFKLPEEVLALFNKTLWELPIDQTFEIQVRTIFSEGWHEVEHDLRYKNKGDWETVPELSRNLNGIFATLATCDWAIIHVFDDFAYNKYKNEEWEGMLRNHWRIHMINDKLTDQIREIFNHNKEVAKSFYRVPREDVIKCISAAGAAKLPKTMSNIIFLINLEIIHNQEIDEITPRQLRKIIALEGSVS